MDQFIQQKISIKTINTCSGQESFLKKPLKLKNYIFFKSNSTKLGSQINHHIDGIHKNNQNLDLKVNQQIFIPKIKNKQLLCQPKFFFSVQRRKTKLQNSSPHFIDAKIKNPQMRGSKIKNEYTKSFFAKRSISLCLKDKPITQSSSKKSLSRKMTTYTNENISTQLVNQINKIRKSRLLIKDQQKSLQKKKNRRPNINENLSFLIRRKKQMKNRISLNRIYQSKSYMTQSVLITPQQQELQNPIYQQSTSYWRQSS